MNSCVPTACKEIKREHARAWGDGYRAGQEAMKLQLEQLAIEESVARSKAEYWERKYREVKEGQK